MPDAKLPHPQGKPCWLDLYVADTDAAIAFYRGLFGWSGEPNPEFGGYAMMSLGERAVAAISPPMPGQPPRPPAWNLYFAVDDAATSAERIGALGGTKFFGPDEVPGTGTLAIGADPAGAQFGLWQPGPFSGFQAAGEAGTAVWFELETNQGQLSAEFYAGLLDVEAPTTPEMPGSYWVVSAGGEQAAGIWQLEGEQSAAVRSHWNPYFQVDDADATVAAALAAGGSVVSEVRDSPYGRFAKLRDPHGAEFTVIVPPAA